MRLIPDFILKLFKKEEPVRYDTFYQNANPMSKEQKEQLKSCRRILTDNGVPINKIKFVFESEITYDVDKNVINPTYKQLRPNNKKHPTIEINIPQNIMTIFLGENRTYNNFVLLKELASKSKRGVALLVGDEYDEVMWLTNLDDAYHYYWTINNLDVD